MLPPTTTTRARAASLQEEQVTTPEETTGIAGSDIVEPHIWSEDELRLTSRDNSGPHDRASDIGSDDSAMKSVIFAVQEEQRKIRADMDLKFDMIIQAINKSNENNLRNARAYSKGTDAQDSLVGDMSLGQDEATRKKRYETAGLPYPGTRGGIRSQGHTFEAETTRATEPRRADNYAQRFEGAPRETRAPDLHMYHEGAADPFRNYAHPSDTRSSRPISVAARSDRPHYDLIDTLGGDPEKDKFLKPPQVKPTDIGYFDPIDASVLRSRPEGASFRDGTYYTATAFWNNLRLVIESYKGPYTAQWHAMIRQTLPFCLKNDARMWYEALSPGAKSVLAGSLDAWSELIDEFRPSLQDRELLAVSYRWNPDRQTAKAYYYQKLAYLVDWLPNNTPSDLAVILTYIREGMDNYLAENVRAHLYPNPSAKKFLSEIKMLDKSMEDRKKYMMKIRPLSARGNTIMGPASGNVYTPAPSGNPDLRNMAQGASIRPRAPEGTLEETYDSRKVSFDKSTSPPTRLYTTPRGRVLRLTEPCSMCRQWHFRFEHNALNTPKANARYAEGYVNWVEDDVTLSGSSTAHSPMETGDLLSFEDVQTASPCTGSNVGDAESGQDFA